MRSNSRRFHAATENTDLAERSKVDGTGTTNAGEHVAINSGGGGGTYGDALLEKADAAFDTNANYTPSLAGDVFVGGDSGDGVGGKRCDADATGGDGFDEEIADAFRNLPLHDRQWRMLLTLRYQSYLIYKNMPRSFYTWK